jgi:hypothetical protein
MTTGNIFVLLACIGEIRNVYNIVERKPEGKRPHGRPRCR